MSTPELIALDAVRRGVPRRDVDPVAAQRLIERGLIEPGGPGDAPFVFSPSLTPGADGAPPLSFVAVIRALASFPEGATLSDIRDAIGDVDVATVSRTLQWLRRQNFAYTTGRTRGARWHLRRKDVLTLFD